MLLDLRVSFFLAIRGILRGSRGSLYLTILIIAMVFTNMIFMPSIILGFIKVAEDQIITYQTGNILISPHEDEAYIEDAFALQEKINRIPGVLRASVHYSTGVTLRYKGNTLGSNLVAINPDDERLVTDVYQKMSDGYYLADGENDEIIIGIQTSGHKDESLDMGATLGYLKAGDPVTVEYTNGISKVYHVKGIIETGSYYADQGAYITWDELESVYGRDMDLATDMIVRTDPDAYEPDVKTQIYRFGIREKVQTWQDLLEEAMGRAVQNFAMLNSITIIVSLIIAVVVLFIVIMIKTLNSRRQIGVLKALGVEKNIIIHNYVFQVLIMTTLGVIVGTTLVESMVAILTVYPFQFPDGEVTPVVAISDLINNTIMLYIVAFIAGYIPAWRVASEDILTAMRS
ncbi:ABC transporter permease [Methanospirillum stamsii]|uniref:ABC transporter permease n=1 Tax=Methanospirillum stamsii TaxID=1277351 RepID=A0A2V2NHZ2_9EURY|nr:FtsX-like permease family protein [Methanospirillum stamsii]PWR75221.1 ABC transporter permease [Methanospirillum stamsii]